MLGKHLIKSWSSTQASVSLSSGENAALKGSRLMKDEGKPLGVWGGGGERVRACWFFVCAVDGGADDEARSGASSLPRPPP